MSIVHHRVAGDVLVEIQDAEKWRTGESVDVSIIGDKWATVLYRTGEKPRILLRTRWHKLAWWRLLWEERRIRREEET